MHRGVDDVRRHPPRVQHVPAALVGRILPGARGEIRRPVHGLQLDGEAGGLQQLAGHQRGRGQERDVGDVHDGHRPTVVARLLHQLAGLLQILLGQPLGAGLGRVGAVAGEDRIAGAVVLRLADPRLQIQVLVHHGDQRLPGLLVVERRMQVVRAQPALGAEGIGQERRQGGVLLDLRHEVDRRDLPPVHLARRQRGGGGRRVGDVAPDDLVEVDLLAPGRSARRLVARHVVGVLHVHDLVARLPLVLHEAERPRPHDLLDLLVGGGARDTGRHHERDVARRLADRLQHGPEALAQLERERLAVHGRDLGGVGGQQPAKAVLLHPALERFGAILGDHGLPVMPLEPVTQGERVLHAITRDGVLVHHLRLDLELLVGAKQRVVDQVGVVAGDIRGGPHRVQDLEVGLGDEAQGPATLLGVDTGGRRGRWLRRSRWPRRGTDDDSLGSSQALLWVACGPPRRGRGDSSTPPGRWQVARPSGTLGPSLVDRPIGASSLHQTASPVGLPAAGT